MAPRWGRDIAASVALAAAASGAAGQAPANRSVSYLHPTDVVDARAVWVNPGGLAAVNLASVHLDLAVTNPGAGGRLRQITAGFSSRGLGASYQRDLLDTGLVGHTYRIGVAGHAGGLAAGVAVAHYRGGARATAWDAGAVYGLGRTVAVGGVVANIGEPDVRGSTLSLTFLPGVSIAPLGPRLVVSAHAVITRDSVLAYAVGARWSVPVRPQLALVVRLDTDRELRRAGFTFGLSAGLRDMLGVVVTTPGDLRDIGAANLYGVVARTLDR